MKRRKFFSLVGASAVVGGAGYLKLDWIIKTFSGPMLVKEGCNKIGVIARKIVTFHRSEVDLPKAKLKAIIEEEYATGKTVVIGSWLYSVTEAKIAAYRNSMSECSQEV